MYARRDRQPNRRVLARRLRGLDQRGQHGHVATVQVTALVLDRPREDRQAGVGRRQVGLRRGSHFRHVVLQHLHIVHAAERVLRAAQRPHERGRRRRAALVCELHGISQLLGRDAHLVERLRGVDLSRTIDRRGEVTRALRDPGRERGTPRVMRRRLTQRIAHGLQPAHQLVDVHFGEAAVHHRSPFLASFNHVRAHVGQRGTRDARLRAEFVDEVQGDVELANGAQRAGQAPDLPSGLASLRALQPVGQDRHCFAEPPRRDTRLVHADAVTFDGRGQIAFERPRPALQQANQGECSIHGRIAADSTEQAVYNGLVTNTENRLAGRAVPPPSCE